VLGVSGGISVASTVAGEVLATTLGVPTGPVIIAIAAGLSFAGLLLQRSR
jgi:hypothetical protein